MMLRDDDEYTPSSIEEAIRVGIRNRLSNLPNYGEIQGLKETERDRKYTKQSQVSKNIDIDNHEFLEAIHRDSIKYGYELWLSKSRYSLLEVSRAIARRGYRGINEEVLSMAGYF
jgi:hypothetical protein